MKKINWPVIYLDINLDEELMPVTYNDWYHDVDTHFAIGPITSCGHFFVDSTEAIYKLIGNGLGPSDVPVIEIGNQVEDPSIIETLIARALKWSGINKRSVSAIAKTLVEQEMC